MNARSRDELIALMAEGAKPTFTFFWGHTPKVNGVADRSCFSQWFPCRFDIDGTTYCSAEQWMMAEKARCFGDHTTLTRILEEPSPAAAKALGRAVTPFDAATWAAARFAVVVRGNDAKFRQNPELRAVLKETGESVLVEAAPRDLVWGIGLGAQNPRALDPSTWRGQNLLGFALMEVRDAVEALPRTGLSATQADPHNPARVR